MDYDSQYRTINAPENPSVDPSPGTPKIESTKVETVAYDGPTVVSQIRMPDSMRKSLRIHALKQDKSFSEMVCHFIASNEAAGKAYVSVQGPKAGRAAA